MWGMDIQAESRIFPQGQVGGKKWSSLVLTEIDSTLWPVFGQEQSSDWTLHKDRLRWLKREGRQRTAVAHPVGCWLSMNRADTHSRHGWRSIILRPARGQLLHNSMPRMKQTHTYTHGSKRQSIRSSWLCHDATIQNTFLQWKLKAALLSQQP